MSDRLNVNQKLRINQSLLSQNRKFQFILQRDGNLVLYRTGVGSLWATGTSNRRVDLAIMQADGNFVLYASGTALWATGTSSPRSWLIVQNDGNVVIYDRSNRAVWSTGTAGS